MENNERVQIGKISIHIGNAKKMNKEQFIKNYSGKTGLSDEAAWNELQAKIKPDTKSKTTTANTNTNNNGGGTGKIGE